LGSAPAGIRSRSWLPAAGAAVAQCVCAGLVIRDASMVAGGVPGRLRRVPAGLLFLELGAGVVASLAGLPPLLSAQPTDRAGSARICAADNARRAAVAVLFAIHTVRFGIYPRPDQGRPPGGPDGEAYPGPAPYR
jgi:hypothetical protein